MKRHVVLFTLAGMVLCMSAQDLKEIKLEKPNKNGGKSVMTALSDRQSIREYADKALSLQDLSDLVWAAVGINRPESGRLTSPTARNVQEIDLYVFFPEGAYFYNAKTHSLIPVVKGDFRDVLAAGQDYVNTAPVVLLMVADISKFDGDDERNKMLGAIDVGIVSQNISIFCAGSNNLATVPRGFMDSKAIADILKLKEKQYPILNHPVGYRK